MKKKCKAPDCKNKFDARTTWQDFCSRQCRQRVWKRKKTKAGKK